MVTQAFQVWQYQSGAWALYTPSLQSYTSDGMFSFTADHFSGYAVTSVPEPATLGVPAASGLLLLSRRTRRRA